MIELLRAAIRDVPDYPKAGIIFKDITPLLAEAELFEMATSIMAEAFVDERITHVVGIESRGFIFGAPIAQALGAGFVPIRKPGKLPGRTLHENYQLEYGTDAVEIHADALLPDARVLLVDDVLATGGTAAAACRLVDRAGAELVACSFLMELTFLAGRTSLNGRRCEAVIAY